MIRTRVSGFGERRMGRGKVQLKRIEDNSSRMVTFSKRRAGLMKKAHELSILCDVEVAVIVFSAKGRLYEFCSGDGLRNILERYQIQKDAKAKGKSVQDSKKPKGNIDPGRGTHLLQMVQRHFEEQKVEELDMISIAQLERQLDSLLCQTRIKKSQLMMAAITALHEKEKQLRDGNQQMEREIEATVGEATVNNYCPSHHQHHLQQPLPVVHPELFADTNTNDSAVLPFLLQEPMLHQL